MSAHTPGPWKVVNHPKVAHVDSQRSVGAGGNGMASVAWLTGGALHQEANARLIAAAPELLEALERLASAWRRMGPRTATIDGKPTAVEQADAAIAKARGGK